ncbi:45425_t:CDS:1, partial [Gigaspora margarita]
AEDISVKDDKTNDIIVTIKNFLYELKWEVFKLLLLLWIVLLHMQ